MFKQGDQIAYVPRHANNNIKHKDVQFGFVMTTSSRFIYCRYWNSDLKTLRTKANSEATPIPLLRLHKSVSDEQVRAAMDEIITAPLRE